MLCDFGNAKNVNCGDRENTVVGTPVYLSPQLRQNLGNSDFAEYNPFKADVYSLGLSLYYAATLQSPRVLASQDHLAANTQAAVDSLQCSDSFKRVLTSMLQEGEADRPDFLQLQSYLDNEGLSQALSVRSLSMGKLCIKCKKPLRSNYYVAKCGHPFCGQCKGSSCPCT